MRLVHNLANIIRPVSFSDCPGWDQDDQALAFSAFRRSADYAEHNRYNSGNLGISFEALTRIGRRPALFLKRILFHAASMQKDL
jgi:hypothetical protein